ncbi:MAG: amino acid adenylation domain-containing protein [bacterium]
MLQEHKKAVLVGETKLCVQCAEYLVDRKWEIVFIVSEDIEVINWARSHSIPIMLMSQVNSAIVDGICLFSIINPQIIPASILENPNVLLALNYHDSPLPKYAGVNSTTWAILNNEKSHGVTLHKITPGIDDGDIVAQAIINIEKDETALSLNLKCSEHLLSLFQDIIIKIETNTLSFSKQNLADRSYYGLKHLPTNYGIVNGTRDVSALTRGLTFGDGYDNPVASVKAWLNNQFYIIEDKVKDIYGNEVNIEIKYDNLPEYWLTDDKLQYLASIKAQERKHKKQILEFFKTHPDASIFILDQVTYKAKKHTKEILLPNNIPDITVLVAAYLVLARFFYRNDFIVSLYFQDHPSLQNLVENRNFIHVNTDMLSNGFDYLENHLTQVQKNCFTTVKDFGYRYNLQLLTDIAITIGEVASTDQHKITIKIQGDGKLTLDGDSAYQLQINSIAESIKTVFDEKITTKDLKHISLLNKAQYQQIVYDWNKTEKDYPKNKTIHQLFEEQVLKTPNNIAVVYENTKLTYQELNNKANQLAHYLIQNYNIQPDDLIALYLDRSEQMIIAMLGVLKAGGAYVPIDLSYPDERVKYILNDTKAKAILTNNARTEKIEIEKTNTIAIDGETVQIKLSKQEKGDLIISTTNSNLAYVIYTSGTTGNPKGVMIEHQGVVSLVKNVDYIKIGTDDSYIQLSDPGFDAATFEVWAPLLNGAKLVIPDSKIDLFGDTSLFRKTVKKNKITTMFLTKTLFDQLYVSCESAFSGIEYLLTGGEAINKKLISKLINSNYFPTNVIHVYGPTENTTFSTALNITKNVFTSMDTIPIGVPLTNRKAYILDKNLNPLPIGVVGELYISGDGIARGYLNRPDLTAEKFIANPFQTEEEKLQNKNGRLYKTGDLVRWLPDGNLEYIGRSDFQVKIRGYRIELGDIESKLLNYPDIKQAVVIAKERILEQTSDKYLLAYYVADKKLDETKIQDYLTARLPEYMLPRMLVHMDKLPLTVNGKLDKKALPEPKFVNSHNYVAPETQLQSQIIKVWSHVLGIPEESISITDSFFSLGGNSILAINLVAKLSKINECKNIRVVDIFKHTNIEQLTNNLNKDTIVTKIKESIETEIAIISISGAFSGCENTNQYWDLIQKGTEGVKRYAQEECIELGISEEILANPNFVPTSGHILNIDKFDAEFWGLAPNEARSIDPQIRKFLEHCCYVLEESGYLRDRDKISIGVFAGAGNSNYSIDNNNKFSSRGLELLSAKDILATKISHLLGLAGAAININTACSTSLTTVIEACIHLASGFCDIAIAGGVSLLQPDEIGHIYQDGLIYSKDGYCRVFDNKSSGIVNGSGVGVVLLKRLSDAKKDNDNIISVIKGYGINNDSNRKMSYTSPSAIGQKECIVNAQIMAGIKSEAISYVECHGTGTKLGDPIEIQALDEAFKHNNQKYKCTIGSVKANIGHADAAAGIAGLIKVCKMLEHKIIPKQINYDTVNPELRIKDTGFEIATEAKEWKDVPLIAGVSSFGIGGTNAHVIVSEYERNNKQTESNNKLCIIPLSAKSHSSLEAYRKSFINYLANTTDSIQDIAHTLQSKREHFDYRLSIVCDSASDAIRKLETENINRINIQKTHNVVFMLPGQGNQYTNMSLGLYQNDSDYKNTINECIKLANKYTGTQFEKILFSDNNEIDQARWAQLSLFIVEYSLAKLLESLNINAACYIGHSIGEYVAATLSGVFILEDAIKLVVIRGKLMQSMSEGAMLSILADATEIEQIVKNNHCEIAVINSPKNCVASGTHESVNNLKIILEKSSISTALLKVSHAFHSRLMAKAAEEFVLQFKHIKLNKPQKRFISNVTGDFITDDEAINPEYWAKHIRSTVLFSDGIKTLSDSYNNLLFIEVGTGKSSISFVKQHEMGKSSIIQLLNSKKNNSENIQDTCFKEDILSKLWAGGYNVDFKSHGKAVRLPGYHFDSSSYWINQQRKTETSILKADLSISVFDNTDIKNKIIEQNLSDKHYEIAKVFLDVLGVEKISIHDDFFKLGGDSLLAVSVVAKLQHNYKISMDDFLRFPTVAKVTNTATFAKNNLRHKLERIKIMYSKKEKYLARDVEDMIAKQIECLHEAQNIKFENKKRNTQTVLLTGATGHVGCNILYQLLHETKCKIYLLIRASSIEHANDKINRKFRHYFDIGLDQHKNRVVILVADIEQPMLGLNKNQYQELVSSIDSIIHSAALVKHYGDYNILYKANVQATINLLELSKLTKNKYFHYISTVAVLLDGYVPKRSYYVFDEDNDSGILLERSNVYSKTKYEGELAVSEYRSHGIKSNIYRLGNVAMHSCNYRHQTNINDNAFYVIVNTLSNLGATSDEIDSMEISPVDNTALAIARLFDQEYLSNMTFHVFNPSLYKLSKLFSKDNRIKTYPINKLIDIIGNKLKNSADKEQVELFMLHQRWLQESSTDNITKVNIVNYKTTAILKSLDFSWSEVNKDMASAMMK